MLAPSMGWPSWHGSKIALANSSVQSWITSHQSADSKGRSHCWDFSVWPSPIEFGPGALM
jgi:hypothetical protein